MSYTARTLVANAWYLSGIVSQGLQTPTGEQEAQGFNLLNAVLAIKTAGNKLIPYFKKYDFTAVVGQESYFIENLIQVETLVFFIGDVRYSMQPTQRKVYFGSPRVENVTSLPFNWHLERELGGARIYLYFKPNTTYPLQLWGKFSLSSITDPSQDLLLTLDRFYIEYLRYALAEYMCQEYNVNFPPQSTKKLNEYEKMITNISPPDMRMTKTSTLTSGTPLSWAQVNLGRGWTVG